MARAKGGLGKGLNALISDATLESGSSQVQNELNIEDLVPNPNQPRTNFNEDELADLADSIKKEGLLQPILVRRVDDKYQIIAGERRWQASKLAKLKQVPVRIVQMDDLQVMRVALIENLQRSDLNPIEEARGYKELMKAGKLTQAQVASAVSKSRSAIANTLRLLDLPEQIQEMIYSGSITAGHARAILSVPDEKKRIKFAEKVANDQISVREAEKLSHIYSIDNEGVTKNFAPQSYKSAAKQLRKKLGTQVKVRTVRGKNKIEIQFEDEADLERILKEII